jgi:hypothetical protein
MFIDTPVEFREAQTELAIWFGVPRSTLKRSAVGTETGPPKEKYGSTT